MKTSITGKEVDQILRNERPSIKTETPNRLLLLGLVLLLVLANLPLTSPPARGQESNAASSIKILFQGGNVPEAMGKVLQSLKMMDALRCQTHVAEAGETIEQVFKKRLSLPGFSSSLAAFAADLNHSYDPKSVSMPLENGAQVCYPDAIVTPTVFAADFNKSNSNEMNLLNRYKQIFGDKLQEQVSADGANVKIEANVYELEIKLKSDKQLIEVLDQIKSLTSQNIRVLTRSYQPPKSDHRSFTINLEGGDVSANAAGVIKSLVDVGAIQTASFTLTNLQSANSLYMDLLGLPGSPKLTDLASEINKIDLRRKVLRAGDSLTYPQIRFTRYVWTQRLNLLFLKDRLRLHEIELDEKHGPLIMKRESVSKNEIILHLSGYRARITVENESVLEKARTALRKHDSKNVLILFPSVYPEGGGYSGEGVMTNEGDLFWTKVVSNQKILKGEQGDLTSYLGLKSKTADNTKRCEPSGECSVVVILDQPIDRHPDLAQAFEIDEDETPAAIGLPFDGENQIISAGDFNNGLNHGTHMAGIVASQDNKYGLIGVNPHATIKSLDWQRFSTNKNDLYDELCHRQQNKRPQIYVFANRWSLDLGGDPLNKDSDREKDQIAKFIGANNSLWVVAAGDDDKDLNWSLADFTPMNLGDKRNVVVVTACEDCFSENARLATNASYSTNNIPFVHIAAPNGPIPSTIRDGNYAAVPGTSQATALTAGVISRMIDNWSSSYLKDSALAKTWIQLTATPFPKLGESHGSTFGIIDINRALLDPEKSYLQTVQPDSQFGSVEAKLMWLNATISCRDAKEHVNKPINTRDIRRIFKQGDRWIFYTTFTPTDGKVFKFGPCAFSEKDMSQPLLAIKGQESLALKDIFDLLLSKNIRLAP